MDARISMKITTSLIDSCFNDCIKNFKDDKIQKDEIECLSNCAKRTTKMMESTADI